MAADNFEILNSDAVLHILSVHILMPKAILGLTSLMGGAELSTLRPLLSSTYHLNYDDLENNGENYQKCSVPRSVQQSVVRDFCVLYFQRAVCSTLFFIPAF